MRTLLCSFVRPHSSVRSWVRSFVRRLVRSCVRSFVRPRAYVRAFVSSLSSFVRSSVRIFRLFVLSFCAWLIGSSVRLFVGAFVQSVGRSVVRALLHALHFKIFLLTSTFPEGILMLRFDCYFLPLVGYGSSVPFSLNASLSLLEALADQLCHGQLEVSPQPYCTTLEKNSTSVFHR